MEKTILSGNQPVHYTDTGTGNPVVLLHGLAEDGSVWEQQVRALGSTYRLVVPDLPGSGLSALPPDVTMESLAGAVRSVLDAEAIPQAVVVGHSMGGYVTLAFAELFPDRLKAFGLFHSTAYADGEEKVAARKKNMAFIRAHGTHSFLKTATPALFSDDSKRDHGPMIEGLITRYRGFDPQSLVAYNEAMLQRPDRTQVLAAAACPVLFIIGKQDGTIPFQQSLQISHMPDTAYIHVLEKSGHMGLMEEAEKSNRVLNKFLEDVFKP